MALIGNGFRETQTGRMFGSTLLNGATPHSQEYQGHMTARMRNMFAGEGITNKQASVPAGKRPPYAWVMASEGGSISSFQRTNIHVSGAAVGEMGFPRAGSATVTVNATAAGGLIVGATGTATIGVDGAAAIVATLNATGTATVTVDGNAALGAIASLTGTATMTVDGHSAIMGLGYMTGTTIETGELTPAGIAAAVWNTLLANHQGDGTAGKALSTAGAGGVDLNALAAAVWAYATRTLTSASGTTPTAEEVAAQVRIELDAELARITKMAKLHGVGVPLVVTPNSRTAGDVAQLITTVGDTTTVGAA